MPLADKRHLLDARIDNITRMSPDDLESFGWREGYTIWLSNGFKITCTTDDEFTRSAQFVGITRGGVKFPFWDDENGDD